MTIENTQPIPNGSPAATPETPPAGGQPAPAAPATAAPGTSPEPKLITIPTRAMAKLKADERERGRKAALAEAQAEKDSQAKKLGFKNWDDMVARGGQQRGSNGKGKRPNQQPRQGQGQSQQPAAANGGGDPAAVRALTRLQRENQKLIEDRRRANRQRAIEEKRRSDAERRLVEREAEAELREAAVRAGVKDVDYAIYMLRRQLAGKTEKELESFNESDFFAKSLRESHPYLYGIEERPATTTPVEPRANPPKPATPPVAPPDGERDARKMTQEQFHADLRRRGLTIPSLGLPGGR